MATSTPYPQTMTPTKKVYPSKTVTPTRTQTPAGEVQLTPTATPPTTPCPHSNYYWKKHSDDWPVWSLTLGSQSYTKRELLFLLYLRVYNPSIALAQELIAAKLNIANGADPDSILPVIASADMVLSSFDGKLPYHVEWSSDIGKTMLGLAYTLDSYNDGKLTEGCSYHNY